MRKEKIRAIARERRAEARKIMRQTNQQITEQLTRTFEVLVMGGTGLT